MPSEEELAEALVGELSAQGLREWMSANGLSRPRGAGKAGSARAAVEQDRGLVEEALVAARAVEPDGPPLCRYHDVCGNEAPSHGSSLCEGCIDASRWNRSPRGPGLDPDDAASLEDHMERLRGGAP